MNVKCPPKTDFSLEGGSLPLLSLWPGSVSDSSGPSDLDMGVSL